MYEYDALQLLNARQNHLSVAVLELVDNLEKLAVQIAAIARLTPIDATPHAEAADACCEALQAIRDKVVTDIDISDLPELRAP